MERTGLSKRDYLDAVEKAAGAYDDAYLLRWTEETEKTGVREHGFPRVAAVLGSLIAEGRQTERYGLWLRMMNLCCTTMHRGKDGNDFAVRELMLCLFRVKGLVPPETYALWMEGMAKIRPEENYRCVASAPDVRTGNWAVYNMAGETLREVAGLTDTRDYFAVQIPAQLLSFDENGMYRDPNEPMLYDAATRCQFSLMLHYGYDGPFHDVLDGMLKKAALCSLRMQSACFELPYGGRSSQFLFNEAYMAACFEYEANRYNKLGQTRLAGEFKRAARLSLQSIGRWLDQTPPKHVKNGFPWDSRFGLEDYAYYDKYMITLGSFLYMAWLFADDAIEECEAPAEYGGYVFETSAHFHKIFANCGGYSVEIDTKADPHYDGTGLGRLCKRGAPSEIALSVPFAKRPNYCLSDVRATAWDAAVEDREENPAPLSISSGLFAADGAPVRLASLSDGLACTLDGVSEQPDRVGFTLSYRSSVFGERGPLTERYELGPEGLTLSVSAAGGRVFAEVPALVTNGSERAALQKEARSFTLSYMGWTYRVESDGELSDSGEIYKNRNGIYKKLVFTAEGGALNLRFTLESI